MYIYIKIQVQYHCRCKEPAEDWSYFHEVPLASDT